MKKFLSVKYQSHCIYSTMKLFFVIVVLFISMAGCSYKTVSLPDDAVIHSKKAEGYAGIWFTLNQFYEYGDKYSGGLGTYTAKHLPLAYYVPEVHKTFFVYGGTIPGKRHLLAMASYYDHKTHTVPRPTIVHDKKGVDDPHDNPSMTVDENGYIWVFVAGRARKRRGYTYRSLEPYSTDAFVRTSPENGDAYCYPQPWPIKEKGFFLLFTKYTGERELYWSTSPDGKNWSPHQKLAGIGGHYQISNRLDDRVITAFNRHINGHPDKRTDLYFLQTDDMGKTWKTIDGKTVKTPLIDPVNDALVKDYHSQNKLVYMKDINFDKNGNPVILIITSKSHQPGPAGEPRTWVVAHWTGKQWQFSDVTISTSNYDVGSIYIEDGQWRIIGPTEAGPQYHGTGGEMAMWISTDEGKTWHMQKQLTKKSPRNHSYARRPVNADPGFYAFWADGDPDKYSGSRLYFCTKEGNAYILPNVMQSNFEKPVLMNYK